MSVVTGIVLVTSLWHKDKDCVVLANDWIEKEGFTPLTVGLEERCCKGKHPQIALMGGGYNYFPHERFEQFVQALPWEGGVHLMIRTEDGGIRSWTKQSDYL